MELETVEGWARRFIATDELEQKKRPPPPPRSFALAVEPLRIASPGRPRELTIATRSSKSPGPEALRAPMKRAQIIHSFWHHELQAAELMAWAILAFPETPIAFRRGLLRIALDEIRHMSMYEELLVGLGARVGAFPVRDWFWERVPSARTPAEFVAVMGVGFEGGNLDHAARFVERFAHAGDDEAARVEAIICEEEIPHVRFAMHWFRQFTGRDGFDAWREHLPPPLSPMVMRGAPMNRDDRRRADLDDRFLDALEAFDPT